MVVSFVDSAPGLKTAGIGSSSQIQQLFGFARRSFVVYIISWTLDIYRHVIVNFHTAVFL